MGDVKRGTTRKGKVQVPTAFMGVLTLVLGIGIISLVMRLPAFRGQQEQMEGERVSQVEESALEGTGTAEMADGGELVEMESVSSMAETEVDPYADKPDIDINSWEFLLANPSHSIDDYEPDLEWIEDVYLDYRIIEPMERFVEDTRAQGLNVLLSSGYRSYDEQSWLFEMQVDMEDGDEEEAATIVARPGTSEHQTGLAADITDDYYEIKNDELENTEMYQWMSKHCQDYGFIVRFPKDKEDITGIIYEPWHFRYVGETAAKYIMEKGLCLEEFLELYQ